MDEQKRTELLNRHGAAAAYGFAMIDAGKAERPVGANGKVLRDLAERMTTALKSVRGKQAKAEYWKSEDAQVERVYVCNEIGKKAGYVEMVDGKCFYREVAAEDLLSIFRAARKAQKENN